VNDRTMRNNTIVLTPASAKHRTGNFGPCHQAEINIQQ